MPLPRVRPALAPLALVAIALLSGCGERAPATPGDPVPPAGNAAPDADASALLFEGARVFDGTQDLGVVSVLVRDGRIEAIGDTLDAPDDVRRIDYDGHWLIPGLVSDHSHLGNTDGTEHGDRFYTRDNVVRDLRRFQAFGVTTVTSLGINGEAFYDIRAEVNGDPALGAYLLGAGPGVGVPGGAPPAANMGLTADLIARPTDADGARAAVREQAERGIDIVKLWVDDLGGNAPQMQPEVYRAAIEEAHARDLKVAAHIHDLAPATDLVVSGVDVIAHGVRDAPVDDALIDAMRRNGTWYIPTVQIDEANYLYAENPGLLDEEPALRAALPEALRTQFADPAWQERQRSGDNIPAAKAAVEMNLRNLRTLHEAGVRIGFGTDSGALPHRVIGFAEHRELELMTQAGFSAQQALTVATRDAAELLGLDDRGVIAAGRRADFVVLDADPLTDIRNTRRIQAVWQAGQEVGGPVAAFEID